MSANAPHRAHALRLLNSCPDLAHREAGFLGHVAVADNLSPKQSDWLAKIMARRFPEDVRHG